MLTFVQCVITGFLVLCCNLAVMTPSSFGATSLALGKSYTVSPSATYRFTAPATDTTSLTDGKYSIGHFWLQQTTVGWSPVTTVEIMIDLEEVSIIDSISFNTARGIDAGVIYPSQIHAFVGPDKDHLRYVGDIADQPDNQIGAYQVRKFQLNNIKTKGRYVLLEILASKYKGVFCDEIEVLQGDSESGETGTLTVDTARNMAANLRWPSLELKQLNYFLANQGVSAASVNLESVVEESQTSPREISAQLLAIRGNFLRDRLPDVTLHVESVNLWSPLIPFADVSVSGTAPRQVSLTAPVNGYDQQALLITNIKSNSQQITLSLAAPQAAADLSLFQVPFVRSAVTEYVPDPLLPETSFTLRPGESRLLLLTARGKAPGNCNNIVNVNGDGKSIPVPVTCQVMNVSLPEMPSLNSVNWGYLTFGLISDRKTQAVQDLFAHHTRVVVVPGSYLKGANLKRIATSQDFLDFENYLGYHKGASKLLLGIGLGTPDHTTTVGIYPFLSSEWQNEFKKWYTNAILTAGRSGFSESQIYIYPYDEISGTQIDDLVKLAVWAREAIPDLKLYVTFGEATFKSNRWEEMLPYLDIAQASYEETLQGVNAKLKGEAWIYNANGTSRSLSPYTYYRLKGWKAFLRGYTGIGFWNYAEIGSETSAWNEVTDDYAVIYEGPENSIISSRRWEAWRMGIEDYELLTMYAKAKGDEAAKALARDVFDNSGDTARADSVRRKIIFELAGDQHEPPVIYRMQSN